MRKISLSNNTVSRGISEISEDQPEELILRIKESRKFAIQLDELTDTANMTYLSSYFRYIYNNSIHEDLLFCQPLHGRTTGWIFFRKLMIFSRKWRYLGRTVFVCALRELLQ